MWAVHFILALLSILHDRCKVDLINLMHQSMARHINTLSCAFTVCFYLNGPEVSSICRSAVAGCEIFVAGERDAKVWRAGMQVQ